MKRKVLNLGDDRYLRGSIGSYSLWHDTPLCTVSVDLIALQEDILKVPSVSFAYETGACPISASILHGFSNLGILHNSQLLKYCSSGDHVLMVNLHGGAKDGIWYVSGPSKEEPQVPLDSLLESEIKADYDAIFLSVCNRAGLTPDFGHHRVIHSLSLAGRYADHRLRVYEPSLNVAAENSADFSLCSSSIFAR